MNHKMLGACFCLPILLGSFLTYSSCSQQSFFFNWEGTLETFERSEDYQKYPSSTIPSEQVLNSYLNNTDFQKMVCQDIVYRMNYVWSYWSDTILLKYKVNASFKGNRLSWDLQICDQKNNVLLWWTIENLTYTWKEIGETPNKEIQFLPVNVTWSQSGYVISDLFWNDPSFHMVMKHREEGDQPFDFAYDFSFKTPIEEQYHLNEQIEYIVIVPYYYEGVVVEEI